jgi:hypothetical protein
LSAQGEFAATGGRLTLSNVTTSVRDTTMRLDGTVELDSGTIKQTATLVKVPTITSVTQGAAGAGFVIPIGGTIRQPVLGVLNVAAGLPALADRVAQRVAVMRAADNQRLMQKSQQEVQEILRPLQGPATMPVDPGTRK